MCKCKERREKINKAYAEYKKRLKDFLDFKKTENKK